MKQKYRKLWIVVYCSKNYFCSVWFVHVRTREKATNTDSIGYDGTISLSQKLPVVLLS